MEEEYSVSVTQLIQKMNLINHTPEIDTDHILIKDPNMNFEYAYRGREYPDI